MQDITNKKAPLIEGVRPLDESELNAVGGGYLYMLPVGAFYLGYRIRKWWDS